MLTPTLVVKAMMGNNLVNMEGGFKMTCKFNCILSKKLAVQAFTGRGLLLTLFLLSMSILLLFPVKADSGNRGCWPVAGCWNFDIVNVKFEPFEGYLKKPVAVYVTVRNTESPRGARNVVCINMSWGSLFDSGNTTTGKVDVGPAGATKTFRLSFTPQSVNIYNVTIELKGDEFCVHTFDVSNPKYTVKGTSPF